MPATPMQIQCSLHLLIYLARRVKAMITAKKRTDFLAMTMVSKLNTQDKHASVVFRCPHIFFFAILNASLFVQSDGRHDLNLVVCINTTSAIFSTNQTYSSLKIKPSIAWGESATKGKALALDGSRSQRLTGWQGEESWLIWWQILLNLSLHSALCGDICGDHWRAGLIPDQTGLWTAKHGASLAAAARRWGDVGWTMAMWCWCLGRRLAKWVVGGLNLHLRVCVRKVCS